jgi:m7GpppX diphosphatase
MSISKIDGNIKKTFLPNHIDNFNEIQIIEPIFKNDIYEKYKTISQVYGELIICKDISKLKTYGNKIHRETYEEYLLFLSKYDSTRDNWIYNILDGKSEQDKILYKDASFIVIPTYLWNNDIEKLHILAMPFDKNIRTIRDLTNKHITLLEHMKEQSLYIINKLYDLQECDLKILIHYEPSTYHFHIHIMNLSWSGATSVEYSHDLNSVIFNLNLDGDYYKKILLNRRV